MAGRQARCLRSGKLIFTSYLCTVRSFVSFVQVVSGQELLAALEKLGSQSGKPRAEIKIVKSGAVVEGEDAAPAPASST